MTTRTPRPPTLLATAITALIGALANGLPASAGPPGVGLAVKPGLWEISTTTTMQGNLIPQAQLDRMAPEQRARIAALMAKRAAAGPKGFVHKSCVTAEELRRGAFRADDDHQDTNCKYAVLKQTPTLQEGTMICSGEDAHSANMRVEAVDADHVKGVINVETPQGKHTMRLSGRWLAASCAGADDD